MRVTLVISLVMAVLGWGTIAWWWYESAVAPAPTEAVCGTDTECEQWERGEPIDEPAEPAEKA